MSDERRQERAERILDAAAELVLRWGYDKTTIDDVAREAGVAKGTIYLHWKSRQELFFTLLRRERRAMVTDMRRGIEDDPNGVTLPGVVRQLGLALGARPLVKAYLVGDRDVIGKLIRRSRTESASLPSRPLAGHLEVLRKHGAIRADLTTTALASMIGAIVTGYLLTDSLAPDRSLPDGEQVPDLMAEAVRRVVDRGRQLRAAEREVVARETRDYLEQVFDLTERRYHDSLDPDASPRERAR